MTRVTPVACVCVCVCVCVCHCYSTTFAMVSLHCLQVSVRNYAQHEFKHAKSDASAVAAYALVRCFHSRLCFPRPEDNFPSFFLSFFLSLFFMVRHTIPLSSFKRVTYVMKFLDMCRHIVQLHTQVVQFGCGCGCTSIIRYI